MATSFVSGGGQITSPGQVSPGVIQRNSLDTTTPGQAVVRKVLAGAGISIVSTGVDPGTGDVTVTNTGGGGAVFVKDSSSDGSITGAINGVNKNFVLSGTPAADSLSFYVRGSLQTEVVHYTLAIDTVTLSDAPQPGDILDASYIL